MTAVVLDKPVFPDYNSWTMKFNALNMSDSARHVMTRFFNYVYKSFHSTCKAHRLMCVCVCVCVCVIDRCWTVRVYTQKCERPVWIIWDRTDLTMSWWDHMKCIYIFIFCMHTFTSQSHDKGIKVSFFVCSLCGSSLKAILRNTWRIYRILR